LGELHNGEGFVDTGANFAMVINAHEEKTKAASLYFALGVVFAFILSPFKTTSVFMRVFV
jgi:hypothetical protein